MSREWKPGDVAMVRHDDGNWWPTDGSRNPDDWGSLVDPVQIREGVQP